MIKKLLIALVLIMGMLLVGSSYSASINPSVFWPTAFLGLLFPFLFAFNVILFALCLIPQKKWLALIPIIAIGISWNSVQTTFTVSANARNAEEYSILTWNVKNFDLYNWSNNENTRALMFELLAEESPDILCLQEFYNEKNGKFKNLKDIKSSLGYKYAYFQPTFSLDNGNRQWGLATFSKYPIVNQGIINFEKGTRLNGSIYTDIELNNNIFRVYNVHLQSYHLSAEEYEFLAGKSANTAENIASGKALLSKLKNGFQNRSNQAIQLYNHKSQYTGNTIIAGDFNDTPVSFSYYLLSKNMQDSFVKKGNGFDKTYVNRSPFFRIDFLLFDESVKINRYKTIEKNYSDHYPVKTVFTF